MNVNKAACWSKHDSTIISSPIVWWPMIFKLDYILGILLAGKTRLSGPNQLVYLRLQKEPSGVTQSWWFAEEPVKN
jgi:hypothetical protein